MFVSMDVAYYTSFCQICMLVQVRGKGSSFNSLQNDSRVMAHNFYQSSI